MSKAQSKARYRGWIIIAALAALVVPWSLVQAGRPIHESRAADPQGEVEIFNLAGKVEVEGWDRSEVEVGGTADDGVDRVDVTGSGRRTSIHVVTRSAHLWGSDGEANLIVHVPAKSSLMVTLVSSDFEVKGVLGDLKVQSVSGKVSGEAGGPTGFAPSTSATPSSTRSHGTARSTSRSRRPTSGAADRRRTWSWAPWRASGSTTRPASSSSGTRSAISRPGRRRAPGP